MTKFALIVPTLNATNEAPKFINALKIQSRQPDRLIVIDSSSTDDTKSIFHSVGAEVTVIERSEFNHGGTRMKAANLIAEDCEIAIFMTQDAILDDPKSLDLLLRVFDRKQVSSAYGRQLPHYGSKALEKFGRLFSYPEKSEIRSKSDIDKFGFRTSFCSNSFSAFRTKTLLEVGGFPEDTIFGEDAILVAELILAGYEHAYVANATVRHSHSYSLKQEFQRYFDIGVMHVHNHQLITKFGSPSGAGRAFVLEEIKYLFANEPWRIPESILRTLLKYLAYNMGKRERMINTKWKKKLSMHRNYWSGR